MHPSTLRTSNQTTPAMVSPSAATMHDAHSEYQPASGAEYDGHDPLF
jgi:hypothetical protein